MGWRSAQHTLLVWDPSISNTGVVLVRIIHEVPFLDVGFMIHRVKSDAVEILFRKTLRTAATHHGRPRLIGDRAEELYQQAREVIEHVGAELPAPDRVLLEDPTDFNVNHQGRKRRLGTDGRSVVKPAMRGTEQGKLCFATGVLYMTLRSWYRDRLETLPSQSWGPRDTATGKNIKHEETREWIRRTWPAAAPCTDHETACVGMAISWVQRARLV